MAPKPLLAPYPPDLADDQPPTVEFGDLVDAVVVEVDWAGQRAPGFSARRVALRRCRLTGAGLAEATIADVTFDECRIDLAGLRHATLERVVFRDCRMGECDLYGATVKDVLFERCELREATISANARARRAARLRPDRSPRGRSVPRCPDAVGRIVENAALFAHVTGVEIVD